MSENDNTQAVIDTAIASCVPQPLDDAAPLYSVVVPEGGEHVVVDVGNLLAAYQDTPRRKKGSVALTIPASLTQYVNRHKVPGTEMFADWRQRKVVAVLNDHDTDGPGWGDHRAVLTLVPTPEWMRWTAHDNKYLSQVEFAEHIIDTTADVVDPSAADLLEMAETFEATKQVNFRSGSRLKDGQRQLNYVETIEAQAGRHGDVTIPDAILLNLSPFDGADLVALSARIRYRIDSGSLRIGYVLDRPDLVLREAFAQVTSGVEEQTGITALWGTPRS